MSGSRMVGWPSAGIVAVAALVAVVLAVQVGSQQTNAPSTQPSGASEAAATGKTGPKLEVDEASLDLGEMWGDQQKEHAIVLRNVGDDTLVVTKVKGSCGCTVIKTYDRQIAPGKEGKLPFTLNTRGMQGAVRKSVTIWTNESANEQTRVSIHGTVKQLIQMEPKAGLTFGRVQPGQSQSKQVELTANADEPVELEIAEVTAEGFNVTLETLEEGKRFLLKAETHSSFERGMHRRHVVLKTNLAKMPELTVPLSAYVPERVTVVPRRIMVFSSTEGKSRPRYAFLRYEGDKAVKILECQASDERIKVEVDHRQDRNNYRITLTLPEDYQPPKGGDKLVIKTDDQEFGEFVIPIVQVNRSRATPVAAKKVQPRAGASAKPAK